MLRKSFLFILIFISNSIHAYVDLDLSYTFSERRINSDTTSENDDEAVRTTTKGYTFNWAWYLWEYTAIEFNYSHTTQKLLDTREGSTTDSDGDTLTIKEQETTVITEVSGVGIRQAFAHRKARIIPALSVGYARYVTSGNTNYTFELSGVELPYKVEDEVEVFNSGYAAFSIRFKITEFIGLSLSAKTIAPNFDTSLASQNVTYSAGFSWLF